jgi:hypothetical protein
VQLAVASLEGAAAELADRYGLVALEGGRHPGRGTANMIVPLGDSYLELIAVVDESEASALPTSMRVRRALDSGRTFAAWAARTEDVVGSVAAFARAAMAPSSAQITDGRRRRPDGVELSWKSAELVPGGAFSPLPFLIEWEVPWERFPGTAPAGGPTDGARFTSIVVSDPDPEAARGTLRGLLAEDLDYTIKQGPPGVAEITLDTPSGPLRLR